MSQYTKLKKVIDFIDNQSKKFPDFLNNFTQAVSKIASYAVANTLIVFAAVQITHKYPSWSGFTYSVASFLMVIMVLFVSFDIAYHNTSVTTSLKIHTWKSNLKSLVSFFLIAGFQLLAILSIHHAIDLVA